MTRSRSSTVTTSGPRETDATSTCTVDGHIANIGSANLNSRSTTLDEEINVVVLDDALVKTLDAHFDDDLDRSVEIRPGRWAAHVQGGMGSVNQFFAG